MSLLHQWMNRLRHLAGRAQFDRELEDEIQFHLETRAAELENRGLARADAMAQARREFGGMALAQETSREAWRFRWLEDFVGDLGHALRSLRRSPAFALTVVLSLAMGMGATSAIYTAMDRALWKPLPVKNPRELVTFSISRDKGEPRDVLPAPFVSQLRNSEIFAGLTITDGDGLSFTYSNDGRAERIVGEFVSPDYFEVLGVQPLLGDGFTPDVRGGHWAAEAVLSYAFWKQRFHEDPGVLGRTIHLNTYPFTIVGVSLPSFFGLERGTNYELRIPILPEGREIAQIREISGSPERSFSVVGRLDPETTLAAAQAATDAQFQSFLATTPIERFRNAGLRHVQILPAARGFDDYVRSIRTPLDVLLILAAVVLLIACFNAANMLLARGAARAGEFALRASIGAGRSRLIRQMLTESLLLSVLGGALGLAIAYCSAGVLFRFLPQGHISLAMDLHPDRRALLFTFAVSLVTGTLFGLLPALQAARGREAGVLKSGTDTIASQGRGARFRRVLVIGQVAFSLVLLIAAAIFVRTLSRLRPADYRSDPGRVLLFTMKPQQEIYTDERKLHIAAEIIRRVSALPGVQSASLAENGPLGSRTDNAAVMVPGGPPIQADLDMVSRGFFDTVGIGRIAGRDFEAQDKRGAPLVAIVNESLARTLFPKEAPVGRILNVLMEHETASYSIVGVVADTRYYELHKAPRPSVWLAMEQHAPYMPTLLVRTAASTSAAMVSRIRGEFDGVDKGFPVFNIKTMELRIEDSLAGERMVADLSGAFGLVALLLAAVGLYGILAYSVSRRTREIGIRMALGASAGSVLRMISCEAVTLVGTGIAAGLVMALIASRAVTHYWSGVSSAEPVSVAACVVGILFTTGASAALPAFRASRIDPLLALRHE